MASETRTQTIERILNRRVQNVFPSREDVVTRLAGEQPLTIYLGIDPTGPHIHMGHSIPMLLLDDLASLGHDAVLLVGDFTARIGDPSDKGAARTVLTEDQIHENMKTYLEQAYHILAKDRVRISYNSEWFTNMTMGNVLRLTSMVTVQQMLARDMFQERIKAEKPIHVSEFLYPLMQGYDSVALKTDVEIGGNDQTFNMLIGRDLEKELLGKDKIVLATKLLVDEGTGKKMSKTEGPIIAVDDSPQEIRRKVLAMDDGMIEGAFLLCTQKEETWIQEHSNDPRAFKEDLAAELVRMYHGQEAVGEATKATEVEGKGTVITTLHIAGIVSSLSEVKKLVKEGAITVNGQPIDRWDEEVGSGDEIKVGKGKFIKVK